MNLDRDMGERYYVSLFTTESIFEIDIKLKRTKFISRCNLFCDDTCVDNGERLRTDDA